MFLWFYGAILSLLMLVSFNFKNIVALPIQTSKPSDKCLKERDTIEQRCGKCGLCGITARNDVASLAGDTAKREGINLLPTMASWNGLGGKAP